MKKALIYGRVSTVMQEDGESLYYQIEKCKDFCKSKGLEVYKTFEDVESGAVDDREGFLKLQEEVKKKSFDILVVYESSRISRRTLTLLKFILELEKNDIKFISISQPELDTTSATGTLLFQIQASLGEYERKQISSRVKSSKLQRAKAGKFQGGHLPLGYTKRDGKIIIDPNTREEVLNIFLNYVDLKSLARVSKACGKPVASVKWILENTFYLGKIPYGRKENNINTGMVRINKVFEHYEGEHEAIITEKLFNEVQELLRVCIRPQNNKSRLLFAGTLKCYCGGAMYQQRQKKHGTENYHYKYKCSNLECRKTIAQKKVETKIIDEILELSELKVLNEVREIESTDRYQLSQNIINKCDMERERVINLYTKGLIEEGELEKKILDIKERKSRAKEQLEELELLKGCTEGFNDNVEILKGIIENMQEEDTEDLREVFKLMIKKITLINREPLELKIYLR